MFSTFKPTLRCGNDRDVENQRFPPSLWKTLRVYHIPTTAPNSSFSCVNVYADSLRKRMRLLTGHMEQLKKGDQRMAWSVGFQRILFETFL
jgi:hypothetical protein